MKQKQKLEQMPAKSRKWLEAECLKLAGRILSDVQYVTIRRLHSKSGPNWKVADIVPQPSPLVSGKIRDRLARLAGTYVLEGETK
jgi:hypothetical protein